MDDSNATTGPGFGSPTPPVGRTLVAGPLTAGQAFGPRYHIIRVLGAGGMGVVYQAWDAELGVAVALKVIRPEVLHDIESAREVERRFKRELVLARQVTHKHVVRIHDLGELDGIKYLTMPFVEGENLADRLRRQGKLAVAQSLAIAKQIASGLEAAHEVGVVHRDLKPENIMISADDCALIMDFGISRSVGGASTATATALGAVIGTLEYMAPEQAQGQAVDHRADIYSFGLLVYDTLVGRQRIAARDNAMSELMGRMQHGPAPLRTIDPAIPEPFERIIARCLQPAADARYATTTELIRDLESLTPDGHQRSSARPAASGARIAIGALAAVLVIVLTGIGWWAASTPAAPAPAAEPVSVLIANFKNDANEPLFDGLVEQALGVGIESASFVSAYPRRDALRLVPAVKRTTLDEETARLIAIREGIDRILSGSIAQDGTRYKLAVRIIDPQAPAEGSATLTLDTEAKDKNDVLNAVGRMAGKVRNGLGDVTVDGNQVPGAETFTAGSLEAAHEYVRAQELQWAGKYEDAIAGYTKAIELDKDLGRAYAGLGAVSNSLGRRQEAEQFFKQALKLLSGMTDREKYRTRSAYFLHIQNPVKAREELEALVAQFPADSTALNNLAVASWQSRDMARALELGRKASAIYPNNVLRRNNVALFAMYAGDFATAEKEAVGVLELNPDFAKAHFAMAMSQLATGRPADAEATWQQLKAKPTGFDLAAQGRADMAVYEGRLSDAADILEEALATPPPGRSPSTTARLLVSIAEVRELQGRGAEAIRLSEEALAVVKGSDHGIVLLAGLVMIKAGRMAQALELAADLGRKIDPAARMNGKLLEGEADLKRGNAVAAYNKFEEAQDLADSWLGRYGMGRAQLEAGDYAAADQEFDRCLRKRNGEATNVLMDDIPTYRLIPPARYYMGRAQEGLGSLAAADSYKVFLDIKQKGDEQGLVADARRRLTALSAR
jgi:tetratricopeptide (TPR) repeat protein/tRNA A-37 threonylcarbamoyl transferase component Bud32